MEALADMMILSELWFEDDIAHLVVWIPGMVDGEPRYRKKHIVYSLSRNVILEVREVEENH